MRYLFQRKEGGNWYLRLQPPGGTIIERSLLTTDLKAAEIAAADDIKAHKMLMYRRRQSRVPRIVHGPWLHEFEPGLHQLPDGGHVMATETDLTFSDGTRRPNGRPGVALVGADLPAAEEFKAFDDAWAGKIGEGPVPMTRPVHVAAKSHPDDAVMEGYIKHKNLSGTPERQAWEIWRLFRVVVAKPLRDCTRDDGRDLVAYIVDQAKDKGRELKSATLHRRMVPLVAAVNWAIAEGKHKEINPFESIVVDLKDAKKIKPFSDDDMKKIRANLHKLDKYHQLLVRVLATTGMRLGEAFQINGEVTEKGIRYCEIGTKNEQTYRRIPFPKSLLPHLPKKITGPLFASKVKKPEDAASKRLAKFKREIDIASDRHGAHSFRHRAADRLRAADVPEDIREAIGGWANGKTSRKYGTGHSLKTLRAAIDRIGF